MYLNLELPRRLSGKNLPANAGDKGNAGSIPGRRRDCEEGNHIPLQDSCLENPMGRGAWWAIVLRVTESDRAEHTCVHLSFSNVSSWDHLKIYILYDISHAVHETSSRIARYLLPTQIQRQTTRLWSALRSNYDSEANSCFRTPDAGLNLGGRVLGDVESNNFDGLPDKGGHSTLKLSKLCAPLKGDEELYIQGGGTADKDQVALKAPHFFIPEIIWCQVMMGKLTFSGMKSAPLSS